MKWSSTSVSRNYNGFETRQDNLLFFQSLVPKKACLCCFYNKNQHVCFEKLGHHTKFRKTIRTPKIHSKSVEKKSGQHLKKSQKTWTTIEKSEYTGA